MSSSSSQPSSTLYSANYDELSRRKTAASTLDNMENFERIEHSGPEPLFYDPQQAFALVTMGTQVLAPRPVEVDNPFLRVYGTFATAEEALEHAAIIAGLDERASLNVVPTHKWFLMPQDEASLHNEEEQRMRAQRHLDRAHLAQRQCNDFFQGRHDEVCRLRDGDEDVQVRQPPPPPTTQSGVVDDDEEDAVREVYGLPKRLPRGGEVRGQSFVCLSTIPDADGGGECIVTIWSCHDTLLDAQTWLRNVACKHIKEYDVAIAMTCEWVYPNKAGHMASGAQYRHSELQRIMDNAEQQPKAVQEFEEWYAAQRQAAEEADAAAEAAATETAAEATETEAELPNATTEPPPNADE